MQNYDIRYDDKYGQLVRIDVAAEGAGSDGRAGRGDPDRGRLTRGDRAERLQRKRAREWG